MILSKLYSRDWPNWVRLALEWINWAMITTVLKGMSFTINGKGYCVSPDCGHDHSPPCNAIYAILAFSGVETILMTVSVASVIYAIEIDRRIRRRTRITEAEPDDIREN